VDFVARVYVTPKTAILDPQGKAVETSLHSLGYDEVGEVRLGKFIELKLSGSAADLVETRVEDMCRSLLANEVIEDYRFELENV
jgi:phosphoribosylformylglycinamidine synthase PurS subunit